MTINTKLISTYSKSLFQSGNQKDISSFHSKLNIFSTKESFNKNSQAHVLELGEELNLIKASILFSKEIESYLKNPTFPEQEKLKFCLEFFPGLSITLRSFLKILAEKNHLALIPEITDAYNKLLIKLRNSIKVKIITASTLEKNLGNQLLNTLKKLTKAEEILLSISYNPKLLGGLIIEYNSIAIDASILREFSFFFSSSQ
jgi:F-type H+-transporting ATPase subunit delta